LLEAHHARVVSVASAAEAITLLRNEVDTIDVVLADIGMPDQDGYAFIASLRADPDARIRHVPAVAVTAYASRTDRSRALDAGFDGHLAKPVDPVRLADAVVLALAARARR
jgi:two-component system CheB/CheR fusion protein